MVGLSTFVMDNGGYSIKVGGLSDHTPRIVPNCIVKAKNERKRVFIGSEMDECTDRSSLFFLLPFERGYLVNWDVEQRVWENVFSSLSPSNCRLVLTDPNCLIPAIRDLSTEVLFEMFGFASVFKSSSAGLVALLKGPRCQLIVDCGYSFTHIVPVLDGKVIRKAVIRIDVGGKALTNQLKEWISYRELNVMEETLVINECKEDTCYVTLDYHGDMQRARKKKDILREYVLPDFVTNMRGIVREKGAPDGQQTVTMNMERFALPEALFRPSDVGLDQMGIAEAVVESVNRCPYNLRYQLLTNIVTFGGSTKFPNFNERLLRDVRSLVSSEVNIVKYSHNPECHPWHCAKKALKEQKLDKKFVTKAQYEEHGENICKKVFDQSIIFDDDEE